MFESFRNRNDNDCGRWRRTQTLPGFSIQLKNAEVISPPGHDCSDRKSKFGMLAFQTCQTLPKRHPMCCCISKSNFRMLLLLPLPVTCCFNQARTPVVPNIFDAFLPLLILELFILPLLHESARIFDLPIYSFSRLPFTCHGVAMFEFVTKVLSTRTCDSPLNNLQI